MANRNPTMPPQHEAVSPSGATTTTTTTTPAPTVPHQVSSLVTYRHIMNILTVLCVIGGMVALAWDGKVDFAAYCTLNAIFVQLMLLNQVTAWKAKH